MSRRVNTLRVDKVGLEEQLLPRLNLSTYFLSKAGLFIEPPQSVVQIGVYVVYFLFYLLPGFGIGLIDKTLE